MLVKIFAARWLGAGLALEAALAVIAGLYGIVLLTAPASVATESVTDIAAGFGFWIIIPLLLKSMTTGGGVILNILGDSRSRLLRIFGAFLGALIWAFLCVEIAYQAQIGGFFITCLVAYMSSIRIVVMAWANIPEPGLMQAYARLFN